MLKRRPLTREDLENMFDLESREIVESLVKNSKISLVDSSGVEFYKIL